MIVTCLNCGFEFPIEAGLVEGDAKRLGVVLAGMEPVLGRATPVYLRLWKPAKTALRLARAVKIAHELAALAAAGTVCRDERSGVRRPAGPALWAEGIEIMASQRERLVLPLTSHGYLREVVFGLADKADAAAEKQREQAARDGRGTGRTGAHSPSPARDEDPLQSTIAWIRGLVRYGQLSQADGEQQIQAAIERHQHQEADDVP